MQGVILLFLIIMNWVIYHKIFKVIYFGSVSKSLGNEFIWCAIAAAVEMAAIMYVGKIVLILLLIVAGIIFAIWLIYKMYKFAKIISKKLLRRRNMIIPYQRNSRKEWKDLLKIMKKSRRNGCFALIVERK